MTITTQTKISIEAKGYLNHGNCKPILCITDGTIYTSVLDAAYANRVSPSGISRAVNGLNHSCKGKQYCFISDVPAHIEAIAQSIQTMHGQAMAYQHILAKEKLAEEIRKQEEACERLRAKLAKEEEALAKLKK